MPTWLKANLKKLKKAELQKEEETNVTPEFKQFGRFSLKKVQRNAPEKPRPLSQKSDSGKSGFLSLKKTSRSGKDKNTEDKATPFISPKLEVDIQDCEICENPEKYSLRKPHESEKFLIQLKSVPKPLDFENMNIDESCEDSTVAGSSHYLSSPSIDSPGTGDVASMVEEVLRRSADKEIQELDENVEEITDDNEIIEETKNNHTTVNKKARDEAEKNVEVKKDIEVKKEEKEYDDEQDKIIAKHIVKAESFEDNTNIEGNSEVEEQLEDSKTVRKTSYEDVEKLFKLNCVPMPLDFKDVNIDESCEDSSISGSSRYFSGSSIDSRDDVAFMVEDILRGSVDKELQDLFENVGKITDDNEIVEGTIDTKNDHIIVNNRVREEVDVEVKKEDEETEYEDEQEKNIVKHIGKAEIIEDNTNIGNTNIDGNSEVEEQLEDSENVINVIKTCYEDVGNHSKKNVRFQEDPDDVTIIDEKSSGSVSSISEEGISLFQNIEIEGGEYMINERCLRAEENTDNDNATQIELVNSTNQIQLAIQTTAKEMNVDNLQFVTPEAMQTWLDMKESDDDVFVEFNEEESGVTNQGEEEEKEEVDNSRKVRDITSEDQDEREAEMVMELQEEMENSHNESQKEKMKDINIEDTTNEHGNVHEEVEGNNKSGFERKEKEEMWHVGENIERNEGESRVIIENEAINVKVDAQLVVIENEQCENPITTLINLINTADLSLCGDVFPFTVGGDPSLEIIPAASGAFETRNLSSVDKKKEQDLENLRSKVLDRDIPLVTLNGDLHKDEKEDVSEMTEDMTREKELEKLKALVKAKDNSIKTFITKSDTLSTEVQDMRDLINEKELALRSLSDSFQAVNERCTFKTRQNQELEEINETLEGKVKVLVADNETGRRRLLNLEDEVVEYQTIQDQNSDVILGQKQLLRKKEEEIGQLKRDYDELIVREKDSLESIRKRANRSHLETEEVKDQIRKVREKMEKEKTALFEELTSTEAARADAVSKMNQAEGVLRKCKEELANTNNRLKQSESESNAMRQKFSGVNKENNIAKGELTLFENQIAKLNNELKTSTQEIESLKIDNDTFTQQRDTMSQKIKHLQDELDEEKENTLKAELLLEETKQQTQTYLTELNGAKARIDHTVTASLVEEEDSRKKWNKRLQESEDELTRMIAKMKISEKKRVQQTAEIEHLTFEMNQSDKNMVSLTKKLSQSDLYIEESHVRESETKEKIESLTRRISDYSSQINTLKTEKNEEISSNRDLRMKIKSLQENVDDLEYKLENSEMKKTEQARILSRLTEQLESATNSLTELEDEVEKSNGKVDKSHKEILTLMEKHTTEMTEKDEEVELVKKTCRGTINLLKQNLDDTENEIRKHMLVKKDLEQEVLLLQGDLDEAEATVNELNDEIPRQQDILEQLGMSLSEASARAEALQDALIRADTKVTTLLLKNDELEDTVKKEEISKRQMEQENIDLNTKVSELTAKNNSLIDSCNKIEDQILEQTSLLEQLEEDKGEWIMSQRKYKEVITCLESDLQHCNDCKETLEENENRMKSKIQEMLTDHEEQSTNLRHIQRVRMRCLEGRISELEQQLDEETTKRTDNEKSMKKLERVLKDMEHQAEEDTKAIERQLDQITTLTSRNKHLKMQYTDAETEMCTLQSRLRKVTVEMEETENRAATMSKVLATPLSSRCNSPSLRQSALLRNSVMGRPVSRTNLMSPEVEQIIFSGRNSPSGLLSPRSTANSRANSPRLGFMSPSRPLSPVDLNIEQNLHLTNGTHPEDVIICINRETSHPTELDLEQHSSPECDIETFDSPGSGFCPTELCKEQTIS